MSYRFAIIGCGHIASRHAEQIAKAGVLAAVCDTNLQKTTSFVQKYNANPYSDLTGLLKAEQVDIVVVCTPNGQHAEHSVKALQSGCHVLCEKPMAISVKDAGIMVAAAAASGKKLFVVKQNRYNAPVIAVKKLLDEGKLGVVHGFQINCFWNRPARYYLDTWRGTLALDGGTLFTQFSHFIDLLYWYLGELKEARGLRKNQQHQGVIEFEDMGVAFLTMKNGALGSLHYTVNAHHSNMEGSITLFAEKGTVKIGGQYLNRIDYFSVENETPPNHEEFSQANDYGFYEGSMSNHHKVYEQLLQALHYPDHTLVEAEEALKSIEMIQQIYGSSPLLHQE